MTRTPLVFSLAFLIGLVASCSTTDAIQSTASVTEAPPVCDADACTEPAPAAPSRACIDGTLAGPVCSAGSDGTCGWTVADCPLDPIEPIVVCDDCSDPRPDAPEQLCNDGTTAGYPSEKAANLGDHEFEVVMDRRAREASERRERLRKTTGRDEVDT